MSSNDSSESNAKPAPRGSLRNQKRWPMWPFALAIFIFIPVYTYLNFQYRKEGKAYEPYQAMLDRMNAIVEKNIYDWYALRSERSADKSEVANKAAATIRFGDNLLDEITPEQLKYYMPTRPTLVPGEVKVESPTHVTPGENMRMRVWVPQGVADDERLHLLAYYKEGDLYLLISIFVEDLAELGDALSGESVPVSFEFPTDPIDAETINVRFLSEGRLAEWQIENTALEKER